MRDQLEQWYELDETLAFSSDMGCSAGAFRLVSSEVQAGLPVANSVREMLQFLMLKGVAAVDDPALAPDQAIIDVTNEVRHMGMSIRSAAFDANACLDGPLRAEFQRLLTYSPAVLAFHAEGRMVMLLDRRNRVLVAAMGTL